MNALNPFFYSPVLARAFVELHMWPSGPVCPHCGGKDAVLLKSRAGSKHPVREGLRKCRGCRGKFTVTTKTALHNTHLPMTAIAAALLRAPDASIRSMERVARITYKSAHSLAKRVMNLCATA